MTIEEAIKHCEEEAERIERNHPYIDATEYMQLAEWLRELKAYREFADWLAKAVLEEDWEDSSDFYAEVLCRKLTKLGHLKVEDDKYVEVNTDDGDSN